MAVPAWQTPDLGEEWRSPSPSPPTVLAPLPPPSDNPPLFNIDSVRAKRGSLRALGHAPARALPPSRSNSAPRVISGHGDGRVLSERLVEPSFENRNASGLLSPPSSRSSSAEKPSAETAREDDGGVGTCVVKEGVDDDRGGALARLGKDKAGKDMFGPTKLERMFQPPSPPQPVSAPPVEPEQAAAGDDVQRRPSHAYVPARPSRLSKSVTPSSASSAETSQQMANSSDEGAAQEDVDTRHDLRSGEIESDLSPFLRAAAGRQPDYPFTFSQDPHPPSASDLPNPSHFDPAEASHSTIHGNESHSRARQHPRRPVTHVKHHRHASPRSKGNPALKLFRSTYDTYTREHLSALVDSIAIEASPSPPASQRDPSDRSASASASASGSGSWSGDAESRSSKRMRMSPSSPARQPGGVRDWGKQGREMMERLRGVEESETSSGASRDGRGHAASMDYASSLPPTPPLQQPREPSASPTPSDYFNPPQPRADKAYKPVDRPTHRSNPSTTSSGYLRAAEDLFARIKQRVVSESASATDTSPVQKGRTISSTTESTSTDERAGPSVTRKKAGPSPRRMLRRLSASEEVKRIAQSPPSDEDDPAPSAPVRTGAPFRPTTHEPHRTDDLARFLSSSTFPTSSTAISTSFVKHRGPRAAKGMRVIRPEEVAMLVGGGSGDGARAVGGMRFDRDKMAWVRDRGGSGLGRVEERTERSGSRGSGESEDVFAGMDSWGQEGGARRPSGGVQQIQEERSGGVEQADESDSDVGEEELVELVQNTTIIASPSSSASTSSDSEPEHDSPSVRPIGITSLRPSSASPPHILAPQPIRPLPHHANSAPPALVSTPGPSGSLPRPIRSAMRNAASTPANALKKQTAWHESVTPAPGGGSGKRSVSFSDGKKSGRILGEGGVRRLFGEGDITAQERVIRQARESSQKEDSLAGGEKSKRTRRIEDMLQGMGDMSLESDTPSKPSRPLRTFDPDSTPRPARSTEANATVLTEYSFGVAQDALIKAMTDAYGDIAYWDGLTSLDLRDKAIENVQKLAEWAPGLEHVDLGDNKLSYLSGVPVQVLQLRVDRNRLSSLTSVGHLTRLEVLDLSDNQLDSLSQLGCLKELRELVVDGNSIKSLEGVFGLEKLEKVSARRNKLARVDLSGAKWGNLTQLDLADNRISSVEGLERLPGLRTLNLDNNRLLVFEPARSLSALRTLKISSNEISSFDLDLFPKLRTLHADGNCLTRLGGTSHGDRLESLSLRAQRVPGLRLGREIGSVKRLYLSGNRLSSASLPSQLASLAYLELAACSLTSLPPAMATRMPGLQILNVNYNFLASVDALRGLQSLRKLSVVGNRLGDGLSGLGGLKGLTCLVEVDLRMNPSTLAFYLPLLMSSSHPSESASPPASPRQTAFNTTLAPPPNFNITQSTIHPSTFQPLASSTSDDYAQLDASFRRNLPDEWYGKRLAYRGLVMRCCKGLRMLDGLGVGEGERRKAEQLLKRAGK